MRKLIAAINMTIDGFCDHTSGIADDELHEHYNELLKTADTMLWGRITYQLMESYWPELVKHPSGNKSMDEFAVLAENISKIVFSRTLTHVDWKNTTLLNGGLEEEVLRLKQQTGKNILVGSPGLISGLTHLGLIDEYQLCIHPVLVGNGLRLFKQIDHQTFLHLLKTKPFRSGAIVNYYEPAKE